MKIYIGRGCIFWLKTADNGGNMTLHKSASPYLVRSLTYAHKYIQSSKSPQSIALFSYSKFSA
jgi:hypothetical protein